MVDREYWSDFDSRIFISALRSPGSRSGAATVSGDELSAEIISIEENGFERDIGYDRTIGNRYIKRDGGLQPASVVIRFLINDESLVQFGRALVTQNGITTARLTNTNTPVKIKVQFETKDDGGGTSGQELYKRIYYNANITNLSYEKGENTEQIGVLEFTISPFDRNRMPNFREAWKSSGDSLSSFNNLEYSVGAITEWDVQMGYSTLV